MQAKISSGEMILLMQPVHTNDSRCVTLNSIWFGSRTFAVHHISHLCMCCMSRTEAKLLRRTPQRISFNIFSSSFTPKGLFLLHAFALCFTNSGTRPRTKLVPGSHPMISTPFNKQYLELPTPKKKTGVLVFWAFFFWRFLACFCGRFAGFGGRFSEFQICGRLRPKLGKHQNYQKFLVVGSSRYTVLHVLLPYISYMLEPTTLHTEQSYNPMPHFYGFSPSSVPLKHR